MVLQKKYDSFEFESYLSDNKELISNELQNICKQYSINIIISVAKKGGYITNYIVPEKAIGVDEIIVPIYNDRYINKQTDFSFLNNKNILIFDDTLKTGATFKHIKDFLLEKIKNSVTDTDVNCNFFFYCLAICENEKLIKDNSNSKIFSFEPQPLNYADYYNFCIQEAEYLQRKYMVTSIDLPIFETYLDKIDDLFNTLNLYSRILTHEKVDVYIGNKLINTELIMLKDNKLKKILGDFIIAFLCKIRYEYMENINKYRVVLVPYAFTASIHYDKLKELYQIIFPDDKINTIKYATNEEKNNSFVKLYRNINFFISYYIGYVLKRLLWINAIEIEYINNGFNQFGYEVNAHVKNTIDDSNFDIYEYLKDFSYSENTVDNTLKNYSYSKLNNYLYEKIIESEKKDGYDDRFIKVELFKKIYNSSSMTFSFCKIITSFLENYSVMNEIEFENKTGNIIRGFKPGECSMTILPSQKSAKIFFPGLYAFYKKCQKNVELYLKNYDLFISKFMNFLVYEDYFKLNLINDNDFIYLTKYFQNVDQDTLIEKVESKLHYLNDKEMKVDQYFISDGINFLLTSVDFNFKLDKEIKEEKSII